MTLAELQLEMDKLTAQATANTDAESAASALIVRLGELIIANQGDPVAIAAIGEALTNNTGRLKTSGDALAAAIVAGTPVA